MRLGDWAFDAKLLALTWRGYYDVDLERMDTCAAMLDWIFQLASKADDWLPDQDLGRFVRLVNELLDPQVTLCSGGRDRGRIEDVRRLIEANLASWEKIDRDVAFSKHVARQAPEL